jgi:hypothetical protein
MHARDNGEGKHNGAKDQEGWDGRLYRQWFFEGIMGGQKEELESQGQRIASKETAE